MEQNREPRNETILIWSISLQYKKEEYTVSGGKDSLFNKCYWETVQLNEKESNWTTFSYHIQK